MPVPTFLIVGAPKAGTTSLYHHLRSHPDVFMSEAKEPHYFSYAGEGQPSWGMASFEEYEALFDGVQHEVAIGEASTWYLYSETAAEEIYRALPDTKIIILLRNPVGRAYSSWSYRVQMGWEEESFEDAIRLEAERRKRGAPWDVHYVNAGRYAAQVERYLERFGEDQVQVLLFEDLRDHADAVVEQALRFVGVDPAFAPLRAEKTHNATAFPRWSSLTRLRQNPIAKSIASALPGSLRQSFSSALRQANRKPRPRMDPDLRREIIRDVQPDAQALSDLVGRNLNARWFP